MFVLEKKNPSIAFNQMKTFFLSIVKYAICFKLDVSCLNFKRKCSFLSQVLSIDRKCIDRVDTNSLLQTFSSFVYKYIKLFCTFRSSAYKYIWFVCSNTFFFHLSIQFFCKFLSLVYENIQFFVQFFHLLFSS